MRTEKDRKERNGPYCLPKGHKLGLVDPAILGEEDVNGDKALEVKNSGVVLDGNLDGVQGSHLLLLAGEGDGKGGLDPLVGTNWRGHPKRSRGDNAKAVLVELDGKVGERGGGLVDKGHLHLHDTVPAGKGTLNFEATALLGGEPGLLGSHSGTTNGATGGGGTTANREATEEVLETAIEGVVAASRG